MTKLAYRDLAYMENTIARQNKIERMAKILFIATSDIEEKEALAEIIRCARDTKSEHIHCDRVFHVGQISIS